jgi:anti-anti-sigma factor
MSDIERLIYNRDTNTIQLFGRFDFSISQEFGELIRNIQFDVAIIVDFSYCNYIDSSGVGALLNLKMRADPYGSDITLLNCNDVVLEILKIANFQKFFDIKNQSPT